VYHCRHFGANLPNDGNIAWLPYRCSLSRTHRWGGGSSPHTPQQVFQYRRSPSVEVTGRNPATGAAIKFAASTVPKFTAGATFKAAVAGKKAAKKK
jgi:hypothetical protein